MMAQNARIDKVQDLMELMIEMTRYVERAIREGTPIHEVEGEVWQRVLQMGNLALRQFWRGKAPATSAKP